MNGRRGHADWLELADVETDFPLSPGELVTLSAHLRDCAECAAVVGIQRRVAGSIARFDPGPLNARVRQRIQEATVNVGKSTEKRSVATLRALAILSLAAVAVSVGAAMIWSQPSAPAVGAGSFSFDWVLVKANQIRIDANGLTAVADPTVTELTDEAGTANAWAVQITWHDNGLDQIIHLGFAADARSWWLQEVRVTDRARGGLAKWAKFRAGPYISTPLGQTWRGDLDLVGKGSSGPVRLYLGGAVIQARPQLAYAAPPGGGKALAQGARPFAPGGELHCMGILQMTPRNAHTALLSMGYRVSWRAARGGGPPDASQRPALGTAVDDWELRTDPPDGVIVDLHIPTGADGAVVIGVVPRGNAVIPPIPPDCPAAATPSG